MKENITLMKEAKEILNSRWKSLLPVTILYLALCLPSTINSVLENTSYELSGGYQAGLTIVGFFVSPILWVGYLVCVFKFLANENPQLSLMFSSFNRYLTILGASVLVCIFIIIGLILLIVPGIKLCYGLLMTPYILADERNQDIGAVEAVRLCRTMMLGYKWQLFCLINRFILWFILGMMSFGIAFIWILPYISITLVKFYQNVYEQHQHKLNHTESTSQA